MERKKSYYFKIGVIHILSIIFGLIYMLSAQGPRHTVTITEKSSWSNVVTCLTFRCSNLNGGFPYNFYGKIDNCLESLITVLLLLDTFKVQCWLILFILNTCKQVLWQAVITQTAFHQCLLCLLRKINNLQVQIYINLKTVNRFKYKMDYSLVILSMCVQ